MSSSSFHPRRGRLHDDRVEALGCAVREVHRGEPAQAEADQDADPLGADRGEELLQHERRVGRAAREVSDPRVGAAVRDEDRAEPRTGRAERREALHPIEVVLRVEEERDALALRPPDRPLSSEVLALDRALDGSAHRRGIGSDSRWPRSSP